MGFGIFFSSECELTRQAYIADTDAVILSAELTAVQVLLREGNNTLTCIQWGSEGKV